MEFGDEALGSVEIAQSDANDSVEAQTCTTVEMRKITKGMTTEERTDESDGAQDDVSLPDSSGINIWLGAFSNLDHPDAMAEMMSLVGGVIASDESSSPGADGETINWWETLRDSLSFDDFDLPTLDMLIEASSQQDLLSDSSDPQLATRLLMHSQLLLARATVLDAESDVDRAITCLSRAAQVSRGEPTTRIDILRELSSAHKRRFQKYGRAEDINSAIEYQQQNIACAGDKHEEYGVLITNLGILLRLRYKVTGDLNDIHAAIERETFALSLIPEIDDNRPVLLANLGSSYRYRFERLGELEDLSKAISFQAQAIQLTSEGHPNMPIHLGHLGNSHMSRFERLGKLDDVTQAIACYSQAVQLTPEGHPDMPGRLDNLGNSYRYRFKHLGTLEDLSRAVELQNKAVELTPEGHKNRPGRFSNLGSLNLQQFEHLGGLEHLDKAIDLQTQAVQLTPEGHPDMPIHLEHLGGSYMFRFERLGQLEDLKKAINNHTQALHFTPEGHPDMPGRFRSLGNSYLCQYERLGKLEDISKVNECLTQAIQLTPEGHPDMPGQLGNLGNLYRCQFDRLGDLEDLAKAIECQNRAIQLTPKGHLDMPGQLNNLGNSYKCRFGRLGELEDLSRAIDCHEKALNLTPEGHSFMPGQLNNLGCSYTCRFERLGGVEDISIAVSCLARAVQLTPEGHPDMPSRLNSLGNSYRYRFEHLGELEDISKAIDCQNRAVRLTPEEQPGMPGRLSHLGSSYLRRFERLGEVQDINKAIDLQTQAVQLTPMGHPLMPNRFDNLGNSYMSRFERLGDLEDIGQAIAYYGQAVKLTPEGHPDMPGQLSNLGNSYLHRFERLGEPEDIEGAITSNTQALHIYPQMHMRTSTTQRALGASYKARFIHFRKPQDMSKALEHLEAATCSYVGSPSIRFAASRDWARLLSMVSCSTPLPAHRATMQLLPEHIWLGSTANRRYECIVETGTIGVEAAAAAISAKEFSLALEWLEEGRSIVWNQIMQLRAPLAILTSVDPTLAQELQQVSRDLEHASRRASATAFTRSATMNLEQDTLQHHRLVGRYGQLISRARDLPGFHGFMRPKKSSELMGATRLGHVVVVNVHEGSCDALMMSSQLEEIAHVALPELSQAGVFQLHRLMMKTLRAKGVRERAMVRFGDENRDHFEEILNTLWYTLVKPILNFFGYTRKLPVDQLPRITWCTTGALSFMPIHAAGNYGSGQDRIFDYAITSYTPTISSLLRVPSQPPADMSGVLAISQQSTPGFSNLPGTKDELKHIKSHTNNLPYMELENSQATPSAVLDAMEKYECVHLACHASQNVEDPTHSCFHLNNGTLSLEDIAQRSLKNKSLAFLSACQTATGDQKMPDEAIHLAAGMLVAGYPSVIATMWSISDNDAPLVADQVYGQLVRDGKLDCSQVARALHVAVGALRAKVGEGSFWRWVPYIHMGV